MTDEQKQAYEWALNQQYQSVAARYARTLAEYIRQERIALKNPQPLTLEELRRMDGEWVWAISSDLDLTVSGWAYIVASQAHTLWEYKPDRLLGNVQLDFEDYGKTWLAYRSKPELPERTEK